MKRNEMREQAFFLAFENLFEANDNLDELIELYSENVEPVCDYAKEISAGIKDKLDEFNGIINTYSKSWKVTRLPKVTLAILYVALYEMKYVDSVPENVAINEAVELAKKYASRDDASYINGILGAVSRGK
ncbi:MAG: transcription antitermination factor NusB [Eubacterium sp.]|nr:transcription antitermination factor NusB [Eubacterium sp.]